MEEPNDILGGKGKVQGGKVTLDMADLQQIISSAVATAVASSANVLAEAIKESKRPYVDEKQHANDETMRQSMREQMKRIREDIAASQDSCPHLQGSNPLSEQSGVLTSIVRHRLDTGEVVGFCTNCTRIFRANDKDYGYWMRRKSGNRLSEAGRRFFLDPSSVIRATLPEEGRVSAIPAF